MELELEKTRTEHRSSKEIVQNYNLHIGNFWDVLGIVMPGAGLQQTLKDFY
jgi:hypothetical protein